MKMYLSRTVKYKNKRCLAGTTIEVEDRDIETLKKAGAFKVAENKVKETDTKPVETKKKVNKEIKKKEVETKEEK